METPQKSPLDPAVSGRTGQVCPSRDPTSWVRRPSIGVPLGDEEMGIRMAIDTAPPDGPDGSRRRRSFLAPLMVLTGALAMALAGVGLQQRGSQPGAAARIAAAPAERPAETPSAMAPSEPSPSDTRTVAISPDDASNAPGDVADGLPPHWALTRIAPLDSAPAPDISPEKEAEAPPRTAMTVPLPIPRPPEFRALGAVASARRAERHSARRAAPMVQAATPPADERSFLEKLFGIERTPALAYAALESKPLDVVPQRRVSPPLVAGPAPSAGVAVYNIAARTVTLPNGERLEAHSGLGEGLDEPRLVNVRMRGPTPPGTYDLTEREQLFHGVRAIRLTPVGGSEAIYGRVGLLAHTFMLGPRGDSNGCVSFRDYDRFLQAYLRGEVQRLVVVTGTQDPLPTVADGGRTRVARNGT